MVKLNDRYTSFACGQGHFEPHPKGLYFVSEKTDVMEDLSHVSLLASTVDTVRQLYKLMLNQQFITEVHELYDQALNAPQFLHLNGYDYSVGSGGQSGYKYRLQNNEEGIIIFIKNRRQAPDAIGSHLKIEFSPKFLLANSAEEVQLVADGIAAWVSMGQVDYAGVAIHLALDVQGWEPSDDFLQRLTTRSRRIYAHDAVESASFTLSEAAVTYGDRQTITVGSVKAVQLCVYDKTEEAKKSDKLALMESIWRGRDPKEVYNPEYDPEQPVRRVEMRFHHTVIKQFERGSDVMLSNYQAAYEHLGALWQYGMNTVRLDTKKDHIDPYWQLFSEDADFHWCHQGKQYKRAYKQPGIGNEKNVALALGNWISIMARNNISTPNAWNCLKKSGIFDDIERYYRSRGIGLDGLYAMIRDALRQRRLVGRAA